MSVDLLTTEFGPGLQTIDLHPDLYIAESNALHGNTDPRFSGVFSAYLNRLALAGQCQRVVAMVPQASDAILDVDRGVYSFSSTGYRNWPERLRPAGPTIYNPAEPPAMFDVPVDGLITSQRGVGLMANTADCAQFVYWAPEQQLLALGHIGREAATKGMAVKMIAGMMRRNSAVTPGGIDVYVGPTLSRGSHVVPELRGLLRASRWKAHIDEVEGGFAIDFTGFAIAELQRFGVDTARVHRSPVDVSKSDDHFSYERYKQNPDQTPNGRNGFVVAIR